MKKIGILVDSGINLSKSEVEKLGWEFIPLTLLDGDNNVYKDDGIDLDPAKAYQVLSQGLLKTSQANQESIKEKYDELLKKYEKIYVIPITEKFSGSYASSLLVAKKYPGKVFVLHSNIIALLMLHVLEELQDDIYADKDFDYIQNRLYELEKKYAAILVPSDMSYLKRSGRINLAKLIVATTLKINPIIKFDYEGFDSIGKNRGLISGVIQGIEKVVSDKGWKDYEIVAIHTIPNEDEVKNFVQMLEAKFNKKIESKKVAIIISAHLGLNMYGALLKKKINYF
ncbi:hypothetical protein ASO20_02200 [Mycoplasma sp. (ex Biomphalaria glabrata)]|nr:hypothetical protein ASO20_02200 [Mycoplasma sp. (ex Biomphalaria glabrata)]